MMKTALVIDDNDDFRTIVCHFLLDADYDVYDARCPEEAFKILDQEDIDFIICDLNMPFALGEKLREFQYSSEVGIRTVEELGWALPTVPIIVVSAITPADLIDLRQRIGSVPVLTKPFSSKKLLSAIEESFKYEFSDTAH